MTRIKIEHVGLAAAGVLFVGGVGALLHMAITEIRERVSRVYRNQRGQQSAQSLGQNSPEFVATPLSATTVRQEKKTIESLPPPTFRRATEAESCYRKSQVDSIDQRALSIPNRGNTCFAATLVQAWLFSHEQALRDQYKILKRTGPLDQVQPIEKLIEFIDSYRKTVQGGGRNATIDIWPFIEVLACIVPDLKHRIEDLRRNFEGYKQKREQLDKELASLRKKLEGVPKKGTNPDLEFNLAYKSAERDSLDSLLQKHFVMPQVDVGEVIQVLYDLIYGEKDSIVRQKIVSLKLEKGEKILDDNNEPLDPIKYQISSEPYGCFVRITLPRVWSEKRKKYIVEAKKNSFPELFQGAFSYKEHMPLQRRVEQGSLREERSVPVESVREFMSRAPNQLVLMANRFWNHTTKGGGCEIGKLEGPLTNIDEIMLIPKEYFTEETETRKYRLQSVIIHDGTVINDGHYEAVVRKFDSQTMKSHFVKANDETISQISYDDMLKCAANAYLLIYELI